MLRKKSQNIGFYILLALSGLVVAYIFWPFWELLAFSVILAILFHPFYDWMRRETHLENLSAGFVVVVIAIILVGPVLLIGQQVFYELAGLYNNLHLADLTSQTEILQHLPASLQHLVATFNVDIGTGLQNITNQAFASLSPFLSSLGWFFGSLIVVAFTTFFLLRDGEQVKVLLMELLPLSEANENILFKKLEQVIGGVVRGQFLVVLTISTASFFGFWIFGLPNPLLWACVMFVAAFVPTFGTSLVWIPSVAYLYLTGHTGPAIGMAIWAGASVALIDNILAAKLVSSRTRLHPILTIFAILGGIVTFGVFGILLGPVLMATFVALLDIYRSHVKA